MSAVGTTASLVDDIDQRIARQHLLSHPFYQAWSRGELSRAALSDYAAQYYHHVAAFPTYLSAVHAQTTDPLVRRQILSNLIDEEAGDPNHPELWLRFAESLGLDAASVQGGEMWPATKSLIERFRVCCSERGTTAGLAALYAYESQIPAVSEKKIDGLKQFYGFKDPADYQYFSVHIEADQEHAAVERQQLERIASEHDVAAVHQSAQEVLDGLYGLLSAVCERHSIQ